MYFKIGFVHLRWSTHLYRIFYWFLMFSSQYFPTIATWYRYYHTCLKKSLLGVLGQDEILRDQIEKSSCKHLCKKLRMKNTKLPTFRFSSVVYNQYNYYYNECYKFKKGLHISSVFRSNFTPNEQMLSFTLNPRAQ